MIVTPSTELDAVNEILSSVGSSPVNSLTEDSFNVDVLNARRILDQVSIEVQSRGYNFNTLSSVTLSADSDTGLVSYPRDVIRVFSTSYKLINRNNYFYDLESSTNQFPTGLTVDEMVKKLSFEELPTVFRKFIAVRAARIFQMRYLTSADINNHLQLEESAAYADLIDYELTEGNYNIFNDDSYISTQIQRS